MSKRENKSRYSYQSKKLRSSKDNQFLKNIKRNYDKLKTRKRRKEEKD